MKTFYPIPPQSTPDDTVCVILRVPKSPQWLGAFWWIIDQYSYWFNWQRTDDKRGTTIAARWRDMFWQAVAENNGASMCPTDILAQIGIQLDEDISMNIRIKPDNPCIIQMWCIDHWEDWYNPLACVPGSIVQPVNGTPLTDGNCQEWNVSLRGSDKWLLPVAVSAGDVISITEATGGWNDGSLGWNCVNGDTFALNACVDADPAVAGDPLMTVNHMRLIMSVDTVWTDAFNAIYAVPAGVTDGQVFFQANDSALSNNSGTVSFHVKVCRQSVPVAPITVTYDLGSGPSEVVYGNYYTFNSSCCGGGGGGDDGVHPHFSQNVKITIISATGFVLTCGSCLYSFVKDGGVTVHSLSSPASTNPADMGTRIGDEYDVECGGGGAPFSITLLIEAP